jgi:hypothetical protein
MKLRKLALTIGWLLVGGCEFHASCGAGRTLDMDNAEALVRRAATREASVEPEVSCPKRVKVEKGGRFDCEIAFGDVKGVATIEQKDAETNVEVVAVTGLLYMSKLEGVLLGRLQQQTSANVSVDCGPRVRAATPGDVFRCRATNGDGGSLDVEVKVKDVTGNVDFAVVPDSVREAPAP